MEYIKLKDICTTTQGTQISKENQYENLNEGLIRYLYIADFKEDNDIKYVKDVYKEKIVSEDDLVMANTGSPGAVFKGKYGVLSNNLFKISFDRNVLIRDFLYYYLSSDEFQHNLQKRMKGGVQKHLGHKLIGEQPIPVIDLETQKKIVEVLDKAQELIDKRKEQIEALDELVKSRFIEMFGDTFLNTKGFEMKKIKDITQIVKGVTYKPEQVSDKGTIVLRSSNIQNSKFDLKDIVRINKKIDEKFLVKQNDILMCNRNGSERLVGKVAKIPMSNEDMTFGTFMTIIRSPYFNYLFSFFQTEGFRRQIKMQTSVAINQISIPLLESVNVPLPPMELQNEFADFVNQVDKLKSQMEISLKELEDNFNCLMQKAFKGELF